MWAINGVHISASALSGRTTAFRDRQSDITQNVMCACNFNMRFTYVHSGWEGSANDSRVMQDALGHVEYEFPWLPRGKKKKKLRIWFWIWSLLHLTWHFQNIW